ncbi:MAG: SDR family oxidoreductase [Armatimonadetes bacterium]|nr:SDR family oxidoreductase [Armatimonadota bacterium]MCX7778408.1 SDR family oxidoreductase [Armatimonadota bacterium]
MSFIQSLFDISGKVAVVTGGAGVLCSEMCNALARCGVSVAVLDISDEVANELVERICAAGMKAIAVHADVTCKSELERAREHILDKFGRIDILINGAGGNMPQATTTDKLSFFDLPEDALRAVVDLNFFGTLLSCQVFGRTFAEQGEGVIVNISSVSAFRPFTRVSAYAAAKAAVVNFTRWLATYMAQSYSPKIRVNTIAPGIFITKQNRYLLIDESGQLTERARVILAHTPLGRFGEPQDLIGALIWLCSNASLFVTGAVIVVDGGFTAFSGV